MINQEELSRRSRMGKLVGIDSVIWWVVAIGGIIWVINANA